MITKPFVGVLLMMCAGAASAAPLTCVNVSQGWARLPPGASTMTAGYMTLRNDCAGPVTIVGARSAAFADVSVHQTSIVDGVSRMQHLHQLRLGQGETVAFKPGGLHLMLMQPSTPLQQGKVVSVALQLQSGDEITVPLTVR